MAEYLLGTRVLWDFLRGDHPESSAVKAWAEKLTKQDTAWISAISLGHLRSDIESLADPARRQKLLSEFTTVIERRFEGRILPFDRAAIEGWALLRSARLDGTPPLYTEEAQVIATALAAGKTYVGQRTHAHDELGLTMVDPWTDSS